MDYEILCDQQWYVSGNRYCDDRYVGRQYGLRGTGTIRPYGWTAPAPGANYVTRTLDLGIGESAPLIAFRVQVTATASFYTNTVYLSSDQTSEQMDTATVWSASIATTKSADTDTGLPWSCDDVHDLLHEYQRLTRSLHQCCSSPTRCLQISPIRGIRKSMSRVVLVGGRLLPQVAVVAVTRYGVCVAEQYTQVDNS